MVTHHTGNQGKPKEATLLHYRLTSEEWIRACRELKPSEKDVLYYLRTLDPFGERDLDIGVREIARELGMNPSTVSRALKELDAKKWIDLEITSARVKLHSQKPVEDSIVPTYAQVTTCGEVLPPRNSVAPTQQEACGKVLPPRNSVASTQRSRSPRNDLDRHATLEAENGEPVENANPLPGEDFSDSEFSTGCTRSVLKIFKKEQTGTAYGNSVEINKEDLGTLLGIIESAGISVNKPIAKTLTELHDADPSKAATRVRNALTAFLEQDHVRNPQAFLNAALKKGFTSNEAKHRSTQNSKNSDQDFQVPPPNRDLSDLLVLIDLECSRLGLTPHEAVQRLGSTFGWESRPFDDLMEDDLKILHGAMVGWS